MRSLIVALSLAVGIALWPMSLPGADTATKEPVKAENGEKAEAAKPAQWAHIELKGALQEGAAMPGLFSEVTEGLGTLIGRLESAAGDSKISGVVLHLEGPSVGWGRLYELRQAIEKIRAKGKKTYAYLPSGGAMDYLLAASCDEVVLPESGSLMMVGMRAEVSFYKNLLDMVGVKPDMLRVGEYKSAAEPYTRTEMSDAFREEMDAILDDYHRQMVEIIAERRGVSAEEAAQLIDGGPYTAAKALELKLIDRIAYEDDLEKLVDGENKVDIKRGYGKKKVDTDFSGMAGFIKMMNLLAGIEEPTRKSRKDKVAVIHASGPIGAEGSLGLFATESITSARMIKAIEAAVKDASVKAIVLRVDSPGGSALESDLIWHALEKVEKPFVVSMGDTAASGGYYISMGADRIFAEPGTLTGSIGVVGGKLALEGLYEKLGVTTTVLSRGKNSGALSSLSPFSDTEREAMQSMMNDIYDQFTRKAAQGRKQEHAELEKLARGRVYTGAMALKLGLVDELGTLDDAMRYAAKQGGLNTDGAIERLTLPKARSPFEQLFGPIDEEVRAEHTANAMLKTLGAASPRLADEIRSALWMNALAREGRLLVMPYRLNVK